MPPHYMYKIFNLKDYEKIDWHLPSIDIAICDYPPQYKKNILFKIWCKAKQYPNKQINLYSGDGPLLVFFNDTSNIKWHLYWRESYSYRLWQAIKSIEIDKELNQDKDIQFTVCSFNGAHNITRTASCVALMNIGLWYPEVCTKNFVATDTDLNQLDHTFVNTITCNITPKQLKHFLKETNSQYTPMDFVNNIKILNTKMKKSFINFFSESEAEADLVNITEKVFLGIVNKTITIVVGQKYWHKVFSELYGFKKYDCFNYDFDIESKFETRLLKVLDQLQSLSTLPKHEQEKIHTRNKDIIQYNYEHFISGKWMEYCEQSLHRLDKYNPEPYNTIGE